MGGRVLAMVLVALAAGCASAPESEDAAPKDDGLLLSTALVRRLPVQDGDTIEVGAFSKLQPGSPFPDGWDPYVLQPANPRTEYRIVQHAHHGMVCVEADAANGFSGMQRLIHISPQRHPFVEWSWLVPKLASDSDPKSLAKPTPRARLMLAFHGDESKLDFEDRIMLRMAKAVTGQGMPYSSLIYVWLNGVPAGTVVRSPYSDRVRLLALDSSEAQFDRWTDFRRDVREDYRRAFGEDPGPIVGVGIFTDVDNAGAPGRAYYGDIRFRTEPLTTAR